MPRTDRMVEVEGGESVSLPLGGLFKGGINMLIFNHAAHGYLNRIEVVCPPKEYQCRYYSMDDQHTNRTIMMYNRGGIYEPIFNIRWFALPKQGKLYLERYKSFNFRDIAAYPDLHQFLIKILKDIKNKCHPGNKNKDIKKNVKLFRSFKENITFEKLVEVLSELPAYHIDKQVINYSSQNIGAIVSKSSNAVDSVDKMFVPLAPTQIQSEYEKTYVEDLVAEWGDYHAVRDFTDTLYNQTNQKIPCKIQTKMVNDGMIVGFLTITNDFIPIKITPLTDIEDDNIDIYENNTYINDDGAPMDLLQLDDHLQLENAVDVDRIRDVYRVQIESRLYNIFRTTLRVLINKLDNYTTKSEMKKIIRGDMSYREKFSSIILLVKKLISPYVLFNEMDNRFEHLKGLLKLKNCLNLKTENLCDKENNCHFVIENDEGRCTLLIPKNNLITQKSNKVIYYGRITDELINFKHYFNFYFKTHMYSTMQYVNYDINDNEVILYQNMLEGDYLKDIELRKRDKTINVKNNYFKNIRKPIAYKNFIK